MSEQQWKEAFGHMWCAGCEHQASYIAQYGHAAYCRFRAPIAVNDAAPSLSVTFAEPGTVKIYALGPAIEWPVVDADAVAPANPPAKPAPNDAAGERQDLVRSSRSVEPCIDLVAQRQAAWDAFRNGLSWDPVLIGMDLGPPETPAEGATAPQTIDGITADTAAEVAELTALALARKLADKSPAKPSNKPAESVPSIGHALRQVNRPVTLVGALSRYMGGRG